jgi:hypothetical protein
MQQLGTCGKRNTAAATSLALRQPFAVDPDEISCTVEESTDSQFSIWVILDHFQPNADLCEIQVMIVEHFSLKNQVGTFRKVK